MAFSQNDGVTEFRGRLKALGCADVLEFLRVLNRRGLLTFVSESASIGLYLRAQDVVHATSTRAADRLSELLVRWDLITREQCDLALRRVAAGEKLGRALLEEGGLTLRALLEARRRQAGQISASVFEWEEGEFVFHEGESPPDSETEVELPIRETILEGIRSVRNVALFRRRMPFDDWVFEPLSAEADGAPFALDPHELHVLHLVDGTRSLGQIGALSEFGPDETLRALFLLFVTGRTKMRAGVARDAAEEGVDGLEEILERYNGMFGLVYQYFMKEVGPISEHLLARSVQEMSETHAALFHHTSLGGDGTVNTVVLRENLASLAGGRRRDALIQGLNELLYAELLVLKRTLGPEHEGRVLRALRDIRMRSPEAEV
jgi:uncharacterized protein DUF4388